MRSLHFKGLHQKAEAFIYNSLQIAKQASKILRTQSVSNLSLST